MSNSIDEFLIRDLLLQGAQIDSFGIGERLITSRSAPVFGGVYKLVAVEDSAGRVIPKIKVSENVEKITTPHFKQVWRLTGEDGKYVADVLTLRDETIDATQPYTIFDPTRTWRRKTLERFSARPMQVPLFKNGVCVHKKRDVHEIRDFCLARVSEVWSEVLRFENPHPYYVDLSQDLWEIKNGLLEQYE